MGADSFYSRFPVWLFWLAVLLCAWSLGRDVWSFLVHGLVLDYEGRFHLLGTSSAAFVFFFFLSALIHRIRSPAVTVSDPTISYGSVFRSFFPPKRVPIAEIAEILPGRPNRIDLRLRSGKVAKIHLIEIAKAQRPEVRAAIERRVRERGAGGAR